MRLVASILLFLCCVSHAAAQDRVALQLTDDLYALTDAIGERVPGSPAEQHAREWAIARLRKLGHRGRLASKFLLLRDTAGRSNATVCRPRASTPTPNWLPSPTTSLIHHLHRSRAGSTPTG